MHAPELSEMPIDLPQGPFRNALELVEVRYLPDDPAVNEPEAHA